MKFVFNPGLYAITPQRYPDMDRLVGETSLVLDGGATMIQFRDKSSDAEWRLRAAIALKQVCDAHGAPLIINDDAQLAASGGAAGVHLGRDDLSIEAARELLGPEAIIGVSCYNDLSLARKATSAGADYVAFGSVYRSASKPGAVHCPVEILEKASRIGLPVVAIGGITPDNGRAVVEAGADSLAVIGAVFDAPDIRAAAAAFSEVFRGQTKIGSACNPKDVEPVEN